jgi:hypothetical protein
MRAKEFLDELKIDNQSGLGAVPLNQDIDHFGLSVEMKPSTFLKLSWPLNPDSEDAQKSIDYIQTNLDTRGIGSPFLKIEIPKEWLQGNFRNPAEVHAHDGRHRMYAVMRDQGDEPIEVHIIPFGLRRKNLTPEMIDRLRMGMISQRHIFVNGPLFYKAR